MSEASQPLMEFQCPNCSKRLKAKSKAIGRPVTCPRCQHQFAIALPPEPSAEDLNTKGRPSLFDEQDLQLENLAIEDIDQRLQSSKSIRDEKDAQRRWRQAKQQAQDEGPSKAPIPTPARSIFDDDLPELVELEKSALPPSSSLDSLQNSMDSLKNMPPINSTNLSALLPELDDLQLQPLPPASPKPAEPTQIQYRVACPNCGTLIYVNQGDEGTKTKCPDCFTFFKVPPPPANWKPSHVSIRHNNFDTSAPLTGDDAIREIDRRRQLRTQQMLELAESELEDERYNQRDFGQDFDTATFVQGTFGFFKDTMAIGFMLGYSLMFAVVFAGIHHGINDPSKIFLVLAAVLVGLLTVLPMFSAVMALLESAANRQLRVSQWPGFNVYEYAADIFVIAGAVMASALPGYLVGLWLGGELDGSGRIQINGAMLSTFLLFPVILISMLDNGSVFQPISWDVIRSFKLAAEAWAGYYLKTLIAFATTMLFWYLLLGQGKSDVLAAFAGTLLPLLLFFTFQQLGTLASAIAEHLSITFTPTQSQDDADCESQPDASKK